MTTAKVQPSLAEFTQAVEQGYNVIPVVMEIPGDLETPVSTFLKLRQGKHNFLLESVEGGENVARYSFIGTNPLDIIVQNGQDPLLHVEGFLDPIRYYPVSSLPSLFSGGLLGYLSYECAHYYEPSVPVPELDELGLPESVLMLASSLVVFDHVQHVLRVVTHCHIGGVGGGQESVSHKSHSHTDDSHSHSPINGSHSHSPINDSHSHSPINDSQTEAHSQSQTESLGQVYSDALERIQEMVHRIRGPLPRPVPFINDESDPDDMKVEPQHSAFAEKDTKLAYETYVSTLQDRIREGDIIQAVPSRRVRLPYRGDPFQVYRELRVVNPSPYMFYLELGDFQLAGASPELLVRVQNDLVTTHPIAGTRKRGANDKEDQMLAQQLLQDPKERAEHTMLVDLGRNDLGRVCRPGTVSVPSLMNVERYSHVMHIVSRVEGTLSAHKTPFDAFRSVFPAGTVSGAPKVRAMQLVQELEGRKRNVYAGAVGYFGFNGTLDSCIAIRTVVFRGESVYLQAGGGIVYDSEAEAEFYETENKMGALAAAVSRAALVNLEMQGGGEVIPPHRKRHAPVEEGEEEQDKPAHKLQKLNSGQGVQLPLSQHFGSFGGRFVPETLVTALDQLEAVFTTAMQDTAFHRQLRNLHKQYTGRPTPLYFAERLSQHSGGARIWLKREDLCHTGAHKINNALGMALLAKRTGKQRIVAETGAGQHGVATATACALLGLECTVYMGAEDVRRQSLNVFRMKLLGATVVPVTSGARTLKDAINEAMRDWVTNVRNTFYLLGSAVGPHPFPTIVRDFQRIIGDETRSQMLVQTKTLPDVCVACVGGGSNAIGMFHPFIEDSSVQLVGVEAAGHGLASGKHSATLVGGSPGVLHGSRTYLLQDRLGQVTETHSVSAGLDYPGVGPQHAHLLEMGRARYVAVSDKEALEGLRLLSRLEGIIPALESAHAVFYAVELAKTMRADQNVVVCLSGRGDKDMVQVAEELDFTL